MSETRPLTDTPDGCWAPQWTVALPVIAKLVVKGTTSSSRLWLASRIAAALAVALPGRAVHLVGDAAYAGKELRQLAPGFTWTTRLRKDAALHDRPPGKTGRRGRPAIGDRLPTLAKLAARQVITQVTVARYGKAVTVHAASLTCGIPSSARGSSRWC
jgi:DDE superfamily endonuclease